MITARGLPVGGNLRVYKDGKYRMTAATSTEHTIGDLAPNGFYEVRVDGARYAQFRADAGGQGTFTYSGGYSTHSFEIVPDNSVNNGPIVGSLSAMSSGIVVSQSVTSDASTTSAELQAASTTTAATNTLPIKSKEEDVAAPVSAEEIKQQIVALQEELLKLLKELLGLLMERLQNASKTI